MPIQGLQGPFGGMAAHVGQLLHYQFIRDLLFPLMHYRDAATLMVAARQRFVRRHYNMCILPCESPAPVNVDLSQHPLPANMVGVQNPIDMTRQPFSNQLLRAPAMDPSAQNPPVCGNPAIFVNAATADRDNGVPYGYTEPSFCMEPHSLPPPFNGNEHVQPHPEGLKLVCGPCKQNRGEDLEWKMNRLKYGVCHMCRKWALGPTNQGGLDVGEDRCGCLPVGKFENGRNNNEKRSEHLCYNHFNEYWTVISQNAANEIEYRAWSIRTYPRRRGHGWTRRRKGASRDRTPYQRAQALRDGRNRPGGLPPYTAADSPDPPKCYCGNPLTNLDHNWDPPMTLDADQIRNCVGCNMFCRTR